MAPLSSPCRPIVVVGMHRSGTSLTASLLSSSGLHFGERLVPAGLGNTEGHFEDLDFVHLHREALQAMGHHPDGWDEVSFRELPSILEAKARALIEARSSRPLWGWKDPRTTLFLPFWERLLPEARFVFVFRNPWEVIDSLFRRGDERFQENPEASERVWSHYNALVLDALARVGDRGILFDLEAVAGNPRAFVEHVGHRFGVELGPPDDVFQSVLLRRGDTLADWRTLSQSVLLPETGLLKQLGEAAHRLAPRSETPKRTDTPPSPQGALLRQWAALRAAERAGEEHGAAHDLQPTGARLQLYVPTKGTYSEAASVVDTVMADGRAHDHAFLVPYDGSAALRLDTGDAVAFVELHGLTVRSRGLGVALSWSGPLLEAAPLRLVNGIRTSPRPNESFSFLSLNRDPQLYLDLPDRDRFRGECQVDIRVAIRTLTDEVVCAAAAALLRELSATEASAALRAQLAAANQATIADLEVRLTEAEEERKVVHERLESSSAAMGELERRLSEAADRWTEARRRLESSEVTVAEFHEREVRRSIEIDGLRAALVESEGLQVEASRGRGALLPSRARRLGWRVLDPWHRVLSAVGLLGRRPTPTPSAFDSDMRCLAQTPFFDADFYLVANADVRDAHIEPRTHYLLRGAAEQRDPSPWFSTAFYLANYPDVAASGANPLVHYLRHGIREGRIPHPSSAPCERRA